MNKRNEHTTPRIRASVCMATYKGARYVGEQLESILTQLGTADELVIVDDASPDDTVKKITAFDDPRIRLIRADSNQGYVRSFQQAALASRGEFIFLADQDDVWIPGRLERMLSALQSTAVVASNFDVLGGGPRPAIPRLRAADGRRSIANLFGILIGYRAYYGCGMAFRRELLGAFAPAPSYLRESHDLWLAIIGNMAGSIAHLDDPTLLRRIHDENATPKGWRSLATIVAARVVLLRLMVEARRRLPSSRGSLSEAS
ncbi:glycosyltransferase family 2 protein [Arthrobacter sp. MI7-26]|uniref:glycosyltransferase family 2 protein n=1 Tax=Arthrobacter sp. MI7-26 TaxID=2993653 RepID=UPI0022487CC4|nr:glycosyltransferase family 2 protein [Arthrobacter sp. MI7-26]MCX2746520.1 glycosyltransferase family 2 protein [Arthrobacter sp. MI7-26]